VLQAIGDVQQFRKQLDAALDSYQKALGLFREIGAKLGEANVYQSLGRMQVLNGNAQEGLITLQNALNIFGEIGNISGQANILFFVGTLLINNGYIKKGIPMVEQAVKLGEQIDRNHPVTVYMRESLQKIQSTPEESKSQEDKGRQRIG
jgi:tetratricopeptide (TPR) repeat protein